MAKEYVIAEVLPDSALSKSFYIRHFESMEEAGIGWPHSHSFFSFVWCSGYTSFADVATTESDNSLKKNILQILQHISI
jgi:hypothetical protein